MSFWLLGFFERFHTKGIALSICPLVCMCPDCVRLASLWLRPVESIGPPLLLKVWTLDVNPSCTRMVTGGSDNQLRVWALDDDDVTGKIGAAGEGVTDDVIAVYMGSVARQGNGELGKGLLNMGTGGWLL